MCILEKCKTCKDYSKCPLLSSVLQRNYTNRNLDGILNCLTRIEKLFSEMKGIGGGNNG